MRACIYNRCSTEEESQINALDTQVQESRELVEKNGWILMRQYVESRSGTTAYKRGEYQKLLEDLEKDLFDVVVVKSIDRLTRSAKDWYIFLDKLVQNHKKLYLYIDRKFYTPEDNLLTGIKAILAEDFSRELSKKIKNAHKRRQEKRTGLNITVPMFGWDKVEKDTYVLNQEEADAYRLAFSMAEEGKGFYTIAKTMYERGVRSKRGGRISEAQWRKMLYSPRAHGTVILHTEEYDFETKKKKVLPETEWIVMEGALPVIVAKEYQEKVLGCIRGKCSNRTRVKRGHYPLSGKIYCSQCGKPYYRKMINTQRQKVVVWKCSTSLKQGKESGCNSKAVREQDVFAVIKARYLKKQDDSLGEENLVETALQLLEKVIHEDANPKMIRESEKKVNKLKCQKKVLLEKLADGVIDDEEYMFFCREIKGQIEILNTELQRMKEKQGEYINNQERLSVIKNMLQGQVIEDAIVRVILSDVERIFVEADGRLNILFCKHL